MGIDGNLGWGGMRWLALAMEQIGDVLADGGVDLLDDGVNLVLLATHE